MSHFAYGPVIHEHGVLFRLWAPLRESVGLRIDGGPAQPMTTTDGGWRILDVHGAKAGTRYCFVLEDGLEIPDPASRYQPEGLKGPSEVVDPLHYLWRTPDWSGRAWDETILYELHVGAFTPEGTFRAAADKLAYLAELGVTMIELMPLAEFPGRWGWGYDGVLHYAPFSVYGSPDDLKAFVDEAHRLGLSVMLDVVYNHFGPDGNYMGLYAPLFTERHHTPWGAGINFDDADSKLVREYVIQNALYWIDEFRMDGLRLDAVHAIDDASDEHLLDELARRVRAGAGDRMIHLVVENEHNDPDLLLRDDDGAAVAYTAQWNDDIHHALHVAATGETIGYYADYQTLPEDLGRALCEGFIYQGQDMPYRGSARGGVSAHLPAQAFVAFIQNHDQIGNRAFGDRMAAYVEPDALRAIASIYLLSPQIPMLFMGEEWATTRPFPYVCDFGEELNRKVREGRSKEMSRLPGFEPEHADKIPDPTSEETFLSAKLDWEECTDDLAGNSLDFYKSLLAIRREKIFPLLKQACRAAHFQSVGSRLDVSWRYDDATLGLSVNLGATAIPARDEAQGEIIWRSHMDRDGLRAPWSVIWTIEPI
ncbi:malto-oligosyltrehalose trehalohydrolase [Rhizobium sp. SG_E_25_P2]|uniref:malto-oligosyltrehalose trehalohydrolase n=1 Tax=Rhizobium sp. SG_E_25_P2 TaxID=2879942 RepID=UPI002473899B|nr:malto-oligosyltrehalose trehalohydrolase [Rhizobium sp. SG_E_25_P2]MDH6264621.1 malto-oligosyltrehalose trehalohydrolase [Rhizobium sp. SG_E_25_P2]